MEVKRSERVDDAPSMEQRPSESSTVAPGVFLCVCVVHV